MNDFGLLNDAGLLIKTEPGNAGLLLKRMKDPPAFDWKGLSLLQNLRLDYLRLILTGYLKCCFLPQNFSLNK